MVSDSVTNPFKGRRLQVPIPTRVIRRVRKPHGHVAEIRERTITQFQAIEWTLFVDGSLLETRMYHGARLPNYGHDLSELRTQLQHDGWEDASRDDIQVL
jgi:hypothetical protein